MLHWLVAYNINILFPHLLWEAEDIRRFEVNALIDHLVRSICAWCTTCLQMRLAVLYDARVHLPPLHALKAWL